MNSIEKVHCISKHVLTIWAMKLDGRLKIYNKYQKNNALWELNIVKTLQWATN